MSDYHISTHSTDCVTKLKATTVNMHILLQYLFIFEEMWVPALHTIFYMRSDEWLVNNQEVVLIQSPKRPIYPSARLTLFCWQLCYTVYMTLNPKLCRHRDLSLSVRCKIPELPESSTQYVFCPTRITLHFSGCSFSSHCWHHRSILSKSSCSR